MLLIHESDVPEVTVPGRYLRWVVSDHSGLPSDECTFCVMSGEPGQTVKPAHSHPDCEELVYFIEGNGQVYVDGVIRPVKAGSAVLFTRDSVHMVRNSGDTEMKAACFYSAATSLDKYVFHPEVDFDTGILEE